MGIGKIISVNLLIFALLNLIFGIVFVAVGGVGVGIGEFFGLIISDIGGFFTAVFTLGGTAPDIFGGVWNYVAALMAGPSIAQPVVGMLWVLLPGLIAGVVSGKKANESSKDAFYGVFFSTVLLALLPLIIIVIPGFGIAGGTTIAQNMVSSIYFSIAPDGSAIWSLGSYFIPLVVSVFNGIFFGGIAAMSSSNL